MQSKEEFMSEVSCHGTCYGSQSDLAGTNGGSKNFFKQFNLQLDNSSGVGLLLSIAGSCLKLVI